MSHDALIIRAATPADTHALSRLSTLGPRAYTQGRGLLAESDGAAVAAISLTTGAVAADLDRSYSRAVGSLRHRRYEILRQGGDVGPARTLLSRLAIVRGETEWGRA